MSNKFETDSHSTSHTNMAVFNASKFQSAIRLETYGAATDCILYIHDRSKTDALKLDFTTLMLIRHVLNAYHDDYFREREK